MNKKLFQIFFYSILSLITIDIKASGSNAIESEKTFVEEYTPEHQASEQDQSTPRLHVSNAINPQTTTVTSRRWGRNIARVVPDSSMYTRDNLAINLHDLPFEDPRARLARIREVNENAQRLRDTPNIDCNCTVS